MSLLPGTLFTYKCRRTRSVAAVCDGAVRGRVQWACGQACGLQVWVFLSNENSLRWQTKIVDKPG